jgi:hypothetical protein
MYSGEVRIHSGKDGSQLLAVPGASVLDSLGQAVDGCSDVNGDGVPDFVAGAPVGNTPVGFGTVEVFSGADGSVLLRIECPCTFATGEQFGGAVAASDITADGYADILVGSPQDATNGIESGRVRVYSGACGPMTPYGTGCPGSFSIVPALTGPACGAVPGTQVMLQIANGLGGSTSLLFFGLSEAAIPMGGGCLLNVTPVLPAVLPIPLGGSGAGNGSATLIGTFPASTAGLLFTMQAFVADPNVPMGFSNTAGLRVKVATTAPPGS